MTEQQLVNSIRNDYYVSVTSHTKIPKMLCLHHGWYSAVYDNSFHTDSLMYLDRRFNEVEGILSFFITL